MKSDCDSDGDASTGGRVGITALADATTTTLAGKATQRLLSPIKAASRRLSSTPLSSLYPTDDGIMYGTDAKNIGTTLNSTQLRTRMTNGNKDHATMEQPTIATKKTATMFQDLVAGGISGSAGVVVGHPLDSIKVKLQTNGNIGAVPVKLPQSLSSPPTLAFVENTRSLFRGIGAPFAAAALVNACIFCVYGSTTRLWDQMITSSNNLNQNLYIKKVLCGATTGFASSFILCPVELVKVRLQANTLLGGKNRPTISSYKTFHSIVRSYGIQGLFRGWSVTCMRQVPGFSIYFCSYDLFKEKLQTIVVANERRNKQDTLSNTRMMDINGNRNKSEPATSSSWLVPVLSGGMAGSLSWSFIYPIDLIKSRISTLPIDTPHIKRSIWNIGRTAIINDGWRSLYRGLGITVFRAFPVNAIILPVHEYSLRMLTTMSIDR